MAENRPAAAHLHADAHRALSAWTPPSERQAALAADYLAFLDAHPDACERGCAPGHLTASTIVFNHDLASVALVLHGIVGAWLAPGGHLEPADASLAEAARREVREELGIEVDLDPIPVSLDRHPITCRGYRSPTQHLDVRFAARAARDADLTCSAESHRVAWWPLDGLPALFDEVLELIDLGRDRLAAPSA